MTHLSPDDRNQLVKLLSAQPMLQTYRGRRQIVEFAGLDPVLPQVDLEGPTFVAIGELVQVLEAYGRVTYEHEALGLFLNAVKETIGPGDAAQSIIDGVLDSYQLMIPAKSVSTPSGSWSSKIDVTATQERIIGENTLRHIYFLQKGLDASRSVVFVDVGNWTGTGFMITNDLLITNNHVIPDHDRARTSRYQFNYQLDRSGAEQSTQNYEAKTDGMFYTDTKLDFTIVEIVASPGSKWGFLPLSEAAVTVDQRVNIIQHPAGMPKQISIQNNFVQYVDDNVAQYVTSTLGGSSGSPVLNDEWQVVALHHAGGNITEPSTGRTFFRNEGIRASAILRTLPANVRSMVAPQ